MSLKPPGTPELALPPSAASSLAPLPSYVEHGGEIACRHPADAIRSRLYGFVVPADRERLNAYCDRLFNLPSGGSQHWEAAADEVLLNFVDIPTMGSTDLLDQQLGVCKECEAAIWFPIVDRRRGRFAWAVPYMFVDSALALAGGREVYGFPKQLGTLEIPVTDTAPDALKISTVTLKTHLPESVAEGHWVVRVTRAGTPVTMGTDWEQLAQLPTSAAGDDIAADLLFFEHLVAENVPMLLLKQFRDAHQQGAACYQAIVRVGMVVSRFDRGGLLPGDYRIEVAQLAGEPISRELGIAADGPPRLAFWLEFDFVVQLAEILWEAGGARR